MSVEMIISLYSKFNIWTIATWKNHQINKLWKEPADLSHSIVLAAVPLQNTLAAVYAVTKAIYVFTLFFINGNPI